MMNEHSIAGMSSGPMRATWRFMRSAVVILSLSAVGCSDAPSSAGQPDGGISPADDLSSGPPPPDVVGAFTLYDGTKQIPIEGATVAYNSQRKSTNALGEATIDVPPGTPFQVNATATGFLPMVFMGITASADFSMSRGLLGEVQLTQLAGALGVTYDPTKAIIAVSVAGADRKSLPQSIKIDTGVAYGFALVPDRSSPVGYKKSNSTVPGDTSQVFLINVAPGTVSLQVTPPVGLACTLFPSSKPHGSEPVIGYARSITTLTLICQ
jgi:hypothetical protein